MRWSTYFRRSVSSSVYVTDLWFLKNASHLNYFFRSAEFHKCSLLDSHIRSVLDCLTILLSFIYLFFLSLSPKKWQEILMNSATVHCSSAMTHVMTVLRELFRRRYTLSPMTKFRQISTNTKNVFLIFDIKSLSGLQANFLISSRLLSPTVYILKDIE